MERYKLRQFAKWARKAGLSDSKLNQIVQEMERGLLGDRLGSDVYKKRIALQGAGKSGGARTIIIFRKLEIAVFIYGYAKNEKSNLSLSEEEALRIFSKELIKLSSIDRAQKVLTGALIKLEE